MPDDNDKNWMAFETLLREYTALKGEQTSRIGFRDNLLYVTMVSVGAVIAFNATNPTYAHSLLVIPWVTFILGWTYVANDQHISRLGKYFRDDLSDRVKLRFPGVLEGTFNWEPFHRADPSRIARKWLQLAVDLATFILPSATSLVIFFMKTQGLEIGIWLIMTLEITMTAVLACAICYYADLFSSRAASPTADAKRRVDVA